MLGGNFEESFGGIAIALALEHGLAEPIVGVRNQAVARILLHESAQCVFGERIVFSQHVTISEIVLVFWRVGRRHHHLLTGCTRITRLRRRQGAWYLSHLAARRRGADRL